MESPRQDPLNLLLEMEPRGSAFWSSVKAAFRPVHWSGEGDYELWHDVFVGQSVPWRQLLQSAVLHAGAVAMLWMISVAWLRQQNVLTRPFDRSSVITYSPEEYLPPLDTGDTEVAQKRQGDPEYSKQPIISVPREADNRSQTIVTPPNVRLTNNVPMPNIIAMTEPIPAVPLDALQNRLRTAVPQATVVPPAPELELSRANIRTNSLATNVIAPPPDVAVAHTRGLAGLEAKVIEPPPADPPKVLQGRTGAMNIGQSAVVAPAPELAVSAQHTLSGRGLASLGGGQPQPVAPPPSLSGVGSSRGGGRLVALGIHPAALGPVAAPGGNRRGTFAATPDGRAGGAGTPGSRGGGHGGSDGASLSGTNGVSSGKKGSLPIGLHVGAMDSATSASGGIGPRNGKAGADATTIADAHLPRVSPGTHAASPVPEDRVTETDRQVFGTKPFYSMTLNMPNLNSATGSWVMRFAELKNNRDTGDLMAPEAMQKSDPGYPMELMRDNVQGTVTLYAVIHSDGSVRDIRVLDSPDDRLDSYASSALARWKFRPASKNGVPVALEAVVRIPFRVKRSF